MQTPVQFFMAHAGTSYDPRKETEKQGRYRGARKLAAAERRASDEGVSFEWSVDPECDSSDWSDEDPHATWRCLARDASGAVVGSFGGVDFGAGGKPWGDPYRRVIEAEIVLDTY